MNKCAKIKNNTTNGNAIWIIWHFTKVKSWIKSLPQNQRIKHDPITGTAVNKLLKTVKPQ